MTTIPALLIFYTPRVGSTLLAQMMTDTGLWGHVRKFDIGYGAGIKHTWPTSWQTFYEQHRHGAGAFATFLGMDYLTNLHANLPARAMPNWLGEFSHFLHLQRRDVKAQAVSWEIAEHTGQFHSNEPELRGWPEYSFGSLAYRTAQIEGWNAQIASWLAVNGKFNQTINLFYESFVKNFDGSLQMIAEFCGLQLPPEHEPVQRYQKQGSPAKTRMYEDFVRGEA